MNGRVELSVWSLTFKSTCSKNLLFPRLQTSQISVYYPSSNSTTHEEDTSLPHYVSTWHKSHSEWAADPDCRKCRFLTSNTMRHPLSHTPTSPVRLHGGQLCTQHWETLQETAQCTKTYSLLPRTFQISWGRQLIYTHLHTLTTHQ